MDTQFHALGTKIKLIIPLVNNLKEMLLLGKVENVLLLGKKNSTIITGNFGGGGLMMMMMMSY